MIAKKAEAAHNRGDLLIERGLLEDWTSSHQPASQTERASRKKMTLAEATAEDLRVRATPVEEASQHRSYGSLSKNELLVDPAAASVELFSSIFGDAFDEAKVDNRTGRPYITKEQYEEAINLLTDLNSSCSVSQSSQKKETASETGTNEQRSHLMGLYLRADRDRRGLIYKDDLLRVLRDDLVRVYQQNEQHEEESNASYRSHKSKSSHGLDFYNRRRSARLESPRAESQIFHTNAMPDVAAFADVGDPTPEIEAIKLAQRSRLGPQQQAEIITPFRKSRASR